MRLPYPDTMTRPQVNLTCVRLGLIDQSTLVKAVKEVTEEDRRRQALLDARPPLDTVLNMHDFETVARTVLPEKAWVRAAFPVVNDPRCVVLRAHVNMTRHTTRRRRTMRSPSARIVWHTNGALHPPDAREPGHSAHG